MVLIIIPTKSKWMRNIKFVCGWLYAGYHTFSFDIETFWCRVENWFSPKCSTTHSNYTRFDFRKEFFNKIDLFSKANNLFRSMLSNKSNTIPFWAVRCSISRPDLIIYFTVWKYHTSKGTKPNQTISQFHNVFVIATYCIGLSSIYTCPLSFIDWPF